MRRGRVRERRGDGQVENAMVISQLLDAVESSTRERPQPGRLHSKNADASRFPAEG